MSGSSATSTGEPDAGRGSTSSRSSSAGPAEPPARGSPHRERSFMRKLIAHRPSPAMIVACIALLVALGGTSVAAVTAIAPNSVGTTQLRTGAVTSAKIKNNNVLGADIAPNAVTGSDVRNGSLTRDD